MFIIQIHNIIDETYIISRHVKLNRVLDYKKKNYYMTTLKNVHFIIKFKKQIFRNFFKLTLIDLTNISILVNDLILNLFIINHNVVFNTSVYIVIIEIATSRDIIIYENENTRAQLKKIIDLFSIL